MRRPFACHRGAFVSAQTRQSRYKSVTRPLNHAKGGVPKRSRRTPDSAPRFLRVAGCSCRGTETVRFGTPQMDYPRPCYDFRYVALSGRVRRPRCRSAADPERSFAVADFIPILRDSRLLLATCCHFLSRHRVEIELRLFCVTAA